ncbi:MAG: hypothetical protein QM796_10860 [Chthoniobacteraceae bacterium]
MIDRRFGVFVMAMTTTTNPYADQTIREHSENKTLIPATSIESDGDIGAIDTKAPEATANKVEEANGEATDGPIRMKTTMARPGLTALLREMVSFLLDGSEAQPLQSAKCVAMKLIRNGHYPPVRGFNAFGDRLGAKGLNLPSVMVDGKHRYDLSALSFTAEEKVQRQVELRSMPKGELRRLVAADPVPTNKPDAQALAAWRHAANLASSTEIDQPVAD